MPHHWPFILNDTVHKFSFRNQKKEPLGADWMNGRLLPLIEQNTNLSKNTELLGAVDNSNLDVPRRRPSEGELSTPPTFNLVGRNAKINATQVRPSS